MIAWLAFSLISTTAYSGQAVEATNYAKIAALCEGRDRILRAQNVSILCLNGLIENGAGKFAATASYDIDYAVVNSAGGDVAAALRLGRKFYRSKTKLIVSGSCMSSCANYLVPASAGVAVLGYSTIVMHGSVPSNLVSYAKSSIGHKSTSLAEIKLSYERARDGIIKDESSFFDDVIVDRGYIERYKELSRTLAFACRPRCESLSDIYLVLDKHYLNAFGIHVLDWKLGDTLKTTVNAQFAGVPNVAIMYGFMGDRLK